MDDERRDKEDLASFIYVRKVKNEGVNVEENVIEVQGKSLQEAFRYFLKVREEMEK